MMFAIMVSPFPWTAAFDIGCKPQIVLQGVYGRDEVYMTGMDVCRRRMKELLALQGLEHLVPHPEATNKNILLV